MIKKIKESNEEWKEKPKPKKEKEGKKNAEHERI